jgi:hypothetical protein
MKFTDEQCRRSAMNMEWQRIETCKFALLHFANANMYLHAKALELYSRVYEDLANLNFE